MLKEKFIILIILTVVLFLSCGQKETIDTSEQTKNYLPSEITDYSVERTSEIRTFVGDSLYEYINGGAELYHEYSFEEVSTAYYTRGEYEVVLDVYRFATTEGAYGLYASLLFEDVEELPLGTEGYYSGGRLEFVKNRYLVRITGYDESAYEMIKNMGGYMSRNIPGNAELPEGFSWFPDGEKTGDKKIFAQSYLGIKGLTDVYTVDYIIDGDTITLFASLDEGGEKFLNWTVKIDEMGSERKPAEGLTYDENLSFVFDHGYYGQVIAGLKNKKLIGAVNYSEKSKSFLANWLNSLSVP